MELELNTLVVQFALIFLPGLLWAGMNSSVVAKNEVKADRFFVLVFFFGLVSYVVVYVGYSVRHVPFSLVSLDKAEDKTIITTPVAQEIAWALLAAFVCGILNIYAATYGWLFRFLRLIGATSRYGSEDLWDYTFNLKTPAVEYVHVRDFEQKLVYAGWVTAFSESGKLRELTLRDVEVFNFDGELFYEVPRLYLARKPEGLHLEFPVKSS